MSIKTEPTARIRAGESFDFVFSRNSADEVAIVWLKQYPNGPYLAAPDVETSSKTYSGTLHGGETKDLDPGEYFLICQKTDTPAGKEEQDIDRIYIHAGWVD